jgi:hypothetical protein
LPLTTIDYPPVAFLHLLVERERQLPDACSARRGDGVGPGAAGVLDRLRRSDVVQRLGLHRALRRRARPGGGRRRPDHPETSLVSLHCPIEDHPEIGRGLDITREHSVADLDENDEWIVGDVSRLERD